MMAIRLVETGKEEDVEEVEVEEPVDGEVSMLEQSKARLMVHWKIMWWRW